MKSHFLSQKSSIPAQCIFLLAVCLTNEASFRAEAQTPTPTPQTFASPLPALPQDIHKTEFASFGQYTTFDSIPAADSASVTVEVTLDDPSASPENLQITLFPGCIDDTSRPPVGVPQFLIWDRELLVDAAGQPVRHIIATAVLPPSILNITSLPGACDFLQDFKYTVQVLHEGYGTDFSVVGTFDSCSLTINPVNPGHIAPPTVNLFGGTEGDPVPAQIDYGQTLTLVATASGNPSTFTITRLGIVITDLQSLQTYRSPEIFQASSTDPIPTLTYTPPILAPGDYQITVRAIDSAGFSQTVSRNLTVRRLFGIFSVSFPTPSPTPNPDSSITFSAQLNLENDTAVNSSDLRVRLVEIASGSFINADGPLTLPPASTLQVDPVSALPARATQQVSVSGTVQAPIEVDGQGRNFINFHVYAVLDEFIDGQWITVDVLKVIDGVQEEAIGFGGPGSGVNNSPPSLGGTLEALVLDSVTIKGPVTVNDASQATYTATATASNSAGSTTVNVVPQWSASQFTINSAGLFHAGHVNSNTNVNITATYTLGGVTKTVTKPVTVIAAATSRLLNISTRLRVLNGDNVLIGGFIITGDLPKRVLLRAIGPSLSDAKPPVPGALPDPVLELHKPDGTVVTNDNWKSSQKTAIAATMTQPKNDKESAIIATLDPLDSAVTGSGAYTAVVHGKGGGTGIGLVEVYDLDQAADSQLANISSRGFVDSGDNALIGGVIIDSTTKVLVRAIGPSLANAKPPVPGALMDPTLELRNKDGALVTSNDDWKDTQQTAIEATMTQPKNDKESAIVRTLAPGNYTAIVRGKNDTTGVALVEIFNLP